MNTELLKDKEIKLSSSSEKIIVYVHVSICVYTEMHIYMSNSKCLYKNNTYNIHVYRVNNKANMAKE
jgi:hypothetical protein